MDTLYYDGRCSLCAGEIARLERLNSGDLTLCDIHTLTETPAEWPSKDTLLRTLHMQTGDGRWLTGADANVAAWQHTAYGWLWGWLRWPLVGRIVDAVYRPWAAWRYRRLYGASCASGACDASAKK